MRYIITTLMVSALAFLIACQSSAAPTSVNSTEKNEMKTSASDIKKDDHAEHEQKDEAARISLEDAKKAFDAGEAIFIDTRSDASFKTEHVKGAVNIPSSDFENRYESLPKDKKIIAYCS